MVQRLIVPLDGSTESWHALDVAVALARRCDTYVDVVHIAFSPNDVRWAERDLTEQLASRDTPGVAVTMHVRLSSETVGAEIEALLQDDPGAIVVMASHGRGRSAALLGSIAEDVLQRTFGPVMLVGPHATVDDFAGPIVVTVDGSTESEAALPLAASWAIELRSTPWVVHVADPSDRAPSGADIMDTAYTARLAHTLQRQCGHEVNFDELHHRDPIATIVDYTEQLDASLIVASSHGRSGWSRLALGSVTAGFVREATCPVLVARLPHSLTTTDRSDGA